MHCAGIVCDHPENHRKGYKNIPDDLCPYCKILTNLEWLECQYEKRLAL